MKNYCSVLLLLLFGSAAYSSIGLYPNVLLEETGTPAVIAPFNLYIYTWPLEEQARFPGNVTAVEYCFQRPFTSSTHIQPVFTLLLLKPLNNGYKISNTIRVYTKDFSSCSYRGGINTCCERRILGLKNQYSVPSVSGIEAFGIYATGENSILGYQPGPQTSTLGFQFSISIIQNGFIALSPTDTTIINYQIFNFVIESSNSATTEPTNSGPSVSDGEGNGSSQTEVLAVTDTITTTITPNSSPISVATDPEMINHSSRTSSAPSATTVIPPVGSTSASQELPIAVTDEESALDRRASAPNNTSITIVASVIGGSIFVLLHIVILAIMIYLCYRAKKPGKTSDVTNENQSSEMDQATVGYGSVLYTRAMPNSCTNSANAEDSDRRSYDSSYYTLPIDNIHRVPPVVLDRNPAYGCQEQSEVEDAYESNSINERLGKVNSYTKILPPTP